MQNPDRLTQGWQVVFGKLIVGGFSLRWLLPTAILILALGVGIPFQSLVVQAQDGGTGSGQRVSAHFVLQVDTRHLNLDTLCFGHTYSLPVTVALQTAQNTGSEEIGDITIRGATIDATTANASVVEVTPSTAPPDDSPNASFETRVDLSGREVGSTTITISATVQSSIVLSLDEEVAMPVAITSQTDPESVPVRVIPCRLQVRTGSLWQTTIGAAGVFINATSNARLEADVNGVFQSPGTTVRWYSIWNRPTGCLLTYGTIDEAEGVVMRGEITGDYLRLTLTFQPLTSARILPNRCPGGFTETGIVPYLDNDPGGTQEAQAISRDPTFTPESLSVDIPITGTRAYNRVFGTASQWLDRSQGRVEGNFNLTIEVRLIPGEPM